VVLVVAAQDEPLELLMLVVPVLLIKDMVAVAAFISVVRHLVVAAVVVLVKLVPIWFGLAATPRRAVTVAMEFSRQSQEPQHTVAAAVEVVPITMQETLGLEELAAWVAEVMA